MINENVLSYQPWITLFYLDHKEREVGNVTSFCSVSSYWTVNSFRKSSFLIWFNPHKHCVKWAILSSILLIDIWAHSVKTLWTSLSRLDQSLSWVFLVPWKTISITPATFMFSSAYVKPVLFTLTLTMEGTVVSWSVQAAKTKYCKLCDL